MFLPGAEHLVDFVEHGSSLAQLGGDVGGRNLGIRVDIDGHDGAHHVLEVVHGVGLAWWYWGLSMRDRLI